MRGKTQTAEQNADQPCNKTGTCPHHRAEKADLERLSLEDGPQGLALPAGSSGCIAHDVADDEEIENGHDHNERQQENLAEPPLASRDIGPRLSHAAFLLHGRLIVLLLILLRGNRRLSIYRLLLG